MRDCKLKGMAVKEELLGRVPVERIDSQMPSGVFVLTVAG